MLTELNNKCVKATLQTGISVFWVQSGICTVVRVCVPCRHSGEWRFSSTHTINLSTTVNAREWSAVCQVITPPNAHWTGGWVGNLFPCQESNYDASAVKHVAYSIYELCYLSSVWYLHPLKSCRVHTAANYISMILKKIQSNNIRL